MRDRLIELLVKLGNGDEPILEGLPEWADVIADYLLANGVIAPPVKVGDTVYFAFHESKVVYEGLILGYSLFGEHFWFNCDYKNGYKNGVKVWWGVNMWHPIENFGKTVFHTREEAEKALKGAEG